MAFSLAACSTHDPSPSPSGLVSEPSSSSTSIEQHEETSMPQDSVPESSQSAAPSSSVPENSENPIPESSVPQEQESSADVPETQEQQILIAYFSRSGNTQAVAEEIEAQTGGMLFEIIPEEPYPEDYDATVARFRREREEDARPALASFVEDMDSYSTIFIGYPIWGGDIPYVVRTFLEQYDLTGKTIVPFCTHGGSRFGSSLRTLETLCPNATILDGYETSGGAAESAANEIAGWLAKIGPLE